MKKRVFSALCAIIIVFTSVAQGFCTLADTVQVNTTTQLRTELDKGVSATYSLSGTSTYTARNERNFGLKADTVLEGNGCTFDTTTSGNDSVIYQSSWLTSVLRNINVQGRTKGDVGIWVGAGNMTLEGCSIRDFNISYGRRAAVAVAGDSTLVLNNTSFSNNFDYDISLYDCARLFVNQGTSLNKLYMNSNFTELNIGDNWSGSFSITMNVPNLRTIGTVGENADISGISITNDGFYLENVNGKLVVKSTKERAIRFDLSERDKLYKGSAGFLYGSAEINVPSIDLLYGLKPNTMVQKALGGLQHPTGDATRTKSSLLASGVEDMQIYFQDMYLEWPYDAPMVNGSIDIDSYTKSVKGIMRGMVCNQEGSLNTELAAKYSYVLFNEPDQIWFGWNLAGLEKAWKQVYDAVRSIDPNARCVGPNYSGFNANDYEHFIKFCYENNCLPQLISWHELGDISLTDFYEHYDFVMGLVEKYYKDSPYQPQLIVNEYARHYDIGSVGGLVKWLAMFEDKDMSGCLAYWAMANSLNELAADQNSPTAGWWVYHWYAQMTGKQCPITYPDFKETRFYGVTSYDEDINMAYCLFGGSEDKNGTEVVYLDNLSSTGLVNDDAVNVKLYAVSFSGQQGAEYKPECIFNGAVKANGNSLRLQVNNTDEMDAYFAVITKPDENAVAVDNLSAEMSTLSYEAEEATLLGGATAYGKTGWTAFATSGRTDVGNINNNGDGVQFNVNVSQDGMYKASVFYSLQSPYVNPQTLEPDANGQNRGIGKTLPFGISVDGKALDNIYLESTVSWIYKNHCDVELYLTAGSHTITYTHINGDERFNGNLQLSAALDKLDITRIDDDYNNFEIDLTEMSNFKTSIGYKVTAVARVAGYYRISADKAASFTKQAVDYASDAKTYSEISTYDINVGDIVYLSKGANTIGVTGNPEKLTFTYESDKTKNSETVITADEMTIHGTNPVYKDNRYAVSGKVISEIGIGQSPQGNESGDKNYVLIKVSATDDGMYNLAVRYTNDEPAPVMLKADGSTYIHPYNIDLVERYAQISVNSQKPETVYFRNTMSWDTFRTLDLQVKLNKGENTIKIYNDNSYQFSPLVNSTAPEIDTVAITGLSYGATVTKLAMDNSSSHSFDNGVVTKQPSCSDNGVKAYTCSVCGYVKDESIPTVAHSFGNNEQNCLACGMVNPDYVAPYVPPVTQPVVTETKPPETTTASTVKKPKAATLSKVTVGKKQFKVTWKKVSGITGYQIQYSTDKKFKKGNKTVTIKGAKKTSTTVKKLKSKKTYYVRIRTYKGKNYSSWSKAKTVKVK